MWLDYMPSKNKVHVQHALNGGEKEININNKTYKIDGFCDKNNTVYEYYGCFWHGCPTCYRPTIINNKNQKDMGTLNTNTIKKREIIKSAGYKHISIYECQLKKLQRLSKVC